MSEGVVLAPPTGVKLDLACGQRPRDGFQGVDLHAPGAKWKVDLTKFPWPWEDSSVEELHCSHYAEHLPMVEVQHAGRTKNLFFAFFDECFRILRPGGNMMVIVPSARSNRAFQDPTHCRFIVAETFAYLSAEWRRSQGLDHYQVDCDFSGNAVGSVVQEETVRHPESQSFRFNHLWNTTLDFHCTLKSLKKGPGGT